MVMKFDQLVNGAINVGFGAAAVAVEGGKKVLDDLNAKGEQVRKDAGTPDIARSVSDMFEQAGGTISDLTERLSFLDLEKTNGAYSLPTRNLGKLGFDDMQRFASLAGVSGLFPSLDSGFLRTLLNAHIKNSSTLLVQGPSYEDLGDKRDLFERLDQAIQGRRLIAFTYQKDTGPKTYIAAEPYKLINHAGVWYLAAVDM